MDKIFFEIEEINNGFVLEYDDITENKVKVFCKDLEELLQQIKLKIQIGV